MSFVKRGFANVFLQMEPTEEHEYLTPTGVGDINIPKGPRNFEKFIAMWALTKASPKPVSSK